MHIPTTKVFRLMPAFLNSYSHIINLTLALIPYTYNSLWDFCSKIHVPVTSFCCFFTKLSSCDFMSFYQFSISLLLDMPVWIFLYLSTASSAASFSSFCSIQAKLQISTYDLLCVFCFIRFRDMQHFFFFPLSLSHSQFFSVCSRLCLYWLCWQLYRLLIES